MKRFFVIIAAALAFLVLAIPSLKAYGLSENYGVAMLDTNSSELSIPDDIGINIPETEESVPIIGIIMWALAAVIIMAALIVIFANIGGAGSANKSVRRERYKKKTTKKSKYSKYKD